MKFKNIYDRYVTRVNNWLCPGMPDTKMVIFVGDKQYNTSREENLEDWVNQELIPWAFMNCIYLHGMIHGNFAVERSYADPKEVITAKDDDYDFNLAIMNFVFAVMAAAVKYDKDPSNKITVVVYWGEADMSDVLEFDDEKAFAEYFKDDLESLEECCEGDEVFDGYTND